MSDCKYIPDTYGRLVGDPVDVVTGANLDVVTEFKLLGPVPFEFHRYYDSSQNRRPRALGWGHTHEYDRRLEFDVDGLRYVRPAGQALGFPPLLEDGQEAAKGGVVLRRIERRVYQARERGLPTFEFRFEDEWPGALPVRAFRREGAIQFFYNGSGHLERVVDSLGRKIRAEHDPQGRLLGLVLLGTESRAERRLLGCRYDRAGNLIEGVDAYRNVFRFAYDGENRMTARADRRGYSFHFEYDREGRCVRAAGEDGLHEVRLSYRPLERVTVVTKADGGEWTYFYSESNTLVQMIDPEGGVVKYILDDQGRVAEEVDPNGNVSRLAYDNTGGLMGKVSPLGDFVALSESPGAIDPGAHRVANCPLEWEYGELLPRAGITPPSATASAIWQLPDDAQRFVRTLAPRQPEASEEDAAFAPSAADSGRHTAPDGTVYDDLGLRLKARSPEGAVRRWSYDAAGNVVRYRDRDGAVFQSEHISWNQRARKIDPLGNTIAYRYTRTEKLAEVVDPGGTVHTYGYDKKDQLIQVRRHGVVKEEYRRDPAGNVIEKRDGEGQLLLSFEIGPGNLRKARHLATGEHHTFEYDKQGRYVGLATDETEVKRAYDQFGHRISELRDGRGVQHQFQGDALVETTVLEKFTTRYQHLPDGTLVIRDPRGGEHRIRRLEHGLFVRTLSNGSSETSQFDSDGRCLMKVSSHSQSGKVWSRAYFYSGEGDLLRVDDSANGTTHYTYDAAHRLIGARKAHGPEQVFSHDRAGNLLQQPGLEGVSLRDGNRLAAANGGRFDYNGQNHVVARHQAGGSTQYQYDARGMLVRCAGPAGAWQASYDPLGRRLKKSQGAKQVEYFWDEDRLAAEVDETGRARIYVYADPFALVPLLFLDYDSLDADPAAGRRYFLFGNQLGAPLLVEDDRGHPVWTARLEPYGAARIDPSSRIDLALRFPGHYLDAETGLHYNRFRYYSPELGRYLQSDPLGIKGGLNLYAYPANPLARVDVLGLTACGDDDDEDTVIILTDKDIEIIGDPDAVTAVRPYPIDPKLLEAVGPPSGVHTNRESEHPYRNPPEMFVVRPGSPLDVSQLDPNRTYLWAVDTPGNFLVAPEDQAGFNRPVKHGDLVPGPDGKSRGEARAGGELNHNSNSGEWEMNNESSYTFQRKDTYADEYGTEQPNPVKPGGDNLNAAHDLLTNSGTDTSNITTVNSDGFDAPGR